MTGAPSIALVSVPVMARSGVYRSTHDLVRAARARGLDWSAIIGVRPTAAGEPMVTLGVREFEFSGRGRAGVRQLRRIIDDSPEIAAADVVISMITQSDVAMAGAGARQNRTWVAWVRGKPWPATGEQSSLRRLLLRLVETRALRAAEEVWATTPVLAQEFATAVGAEIIPAGIPSTLRLSTGLHAGGPLVWAGRVDTDKRPALFVDIVERTGHPGRIFGDGPLRAGLSTRKVAGLSWEGWSDADALWKGASVFVGTSDREAFGRSAVEAAAAGLPLVIGANYGAAPLLFTSPELADACVIDSNDPDDWAAAVTRLINNEPLRVAVSEHVYTNAQALTIEASVERASQRGATLLRSGSAS